MTQTPDPKISRRLAQRHENLVETLQKLVRTVQAKAAQRPGLGVPDALRAEAEALLFEVQPFRARRVQRALPVAAPHYGGLAAQLGEALTALIGFEARHTHWHALRQEVHWSVADGKFMPVRRLAPRPGSKAAALAHAKAEEEKSLRAARSAELRAKLIDRLTRAAMD